VAARRTVRCTEQLQPSPLLRPSRLLNVSVVVAADIGPAPAPSRPNALIAAVVVAVWVGPGKHEEPVVDSMVLGGNSGMSHAATRKRARKADSGTVESRAHASKTTRAHADLTHPTPAHAATGLAATGHAATGHAATGHAATRHPP